MTRPPDRKRRGRPPAGRAAALGPILLAAILACDPVVTDIPGARRPLEPLPIYPQWFEETEACSGLDGEFELIEWYTADYILLEDGTQLRGQWWWPHDIVLREGLQDYDFLVKHEMLHDLLQGDQEHEGEEWMDCRLHPLHEG